MTRPDPLAVGEETRDEYLDRLEQYEADTDPNRPQRDEPMNVTRPSPLAVECPKCHAIQGEPCRVNMIWGERTPHVARVRATEKKEESRVRVP